MIFIIMGVSGSGKSTIGQALAHYLALPFFDADDFHPLSNIQKMEAGQPLTDEDRWPWLDALADLLEQQSQKKGAVLACSALKESYRNRLVQAGKIVPHWVLLDGTLELIEARMRQRKGHFMKASMLASQLATLEKPDYAFSIRINQSPPQLLRQIIAHFNLTMESSQFGLLGLGVMGRSLSLNIAEKGFRLSVYNRNTPEEASVVADFLEGNSDFKNIRGFQDLAAFVQSLERPRRILLMVKAGAAVDQLLAQLQPLLEPGDIVLDGGNSHYPDTERRFAALQDKGIHFMGVGISGGEAGARSGPSMMPGGSEAAYEQVGPVLEAIAAKDQQGKPCCARVGSGGAGHFVKMVHNGIEYAEMQLLAELYALLSHQLDQETLADLLESWNQTDLSSYLLEITVAILRKKEGEQYLLDLILDQAGNKGTGSWSTKATLDLGYPATMIAAAVFARYISAYKNRRKRWGVKFKPIQSDAFDLAAVEAAYRCARILNHHQGFALLHEASMTYQWHLRLPEIARLWTNGCIIRSRMMEQLVERLQGEPLILDQPKIHHYLLSHESDLRNLLESSLNLRSPSPCFSTAYQYWIAATTERLPANLIQAQRDYFGAHTYQRIDAPSDQFFHTDW